MNDTLKFILGITAIIGFIWYINESNLKKDNDNQYYVKIFKKQISVCGKNTFITDFTYGDELDVYELIDEIEALCE